MSDKMPQSANNANHTESISRQLRTPLTDILGMAHLLNDTVLETDQQEYVRAIMRASHELLVSVDNNLDLVQLDDDVLGVREEFFGITEALLVMVERLRPSAKANNLELSLDLAPDIGTKIHCDKSRLSQAVYNLAAHLIAQHTNGALRIAAMIKEDQWGDTLCVTITASAQKNSLAETDNEQNEALDITRRLARLMGGDATFSAEEGQSNVGQLSIRVEKPEEEKDDTPQAARILVAEDSRANQRLIGLILNKLGHEFELAADGLEAVEAVKTSRFDMVLMDLHMPHMDGMEASQTIRALDDEVAAMTPIFALTADVRPEVPGLILDAGMDALLSKPLDVEKLAETIQATMNMSRKRQLKLVKSA